MKTVILDDSVTSEPCHIDILDDLDCESVEQFYIRLESLNPNCNVNNTPIPVNILDDGEYLLACPNTLPTSAKISKAEGSRYAIPLSVMCSYFPLHVTLQLI